MGMLTSSLEKVEWDPSHVCGSKPGFLEKSLGGEVWWICRIELSLDLVDSSLNSFVFRGNYGKEGLILLLVIFDGG